MPKLDMTLVKALLRKDRRYLGDVRRLATATGIPYGTLRNAIGSGDEMRWERVVQVADALGIEDAEQIIESTGIPDEPPEQPPNTPKAPPRRKDEKKRGPKRDAGNWRAAS